MTKHASTQGKTRLKSIAIPAEHGSWGLVLEPILLGLLVAPSWAGLLLAIGAFATFLVRWPIKVALLEKQRRRSQRLTVAIRFAGLYGVAALLGITGAIWLGGWTFLLPLVMALPFGFIFLYYDFNNQSRSWQAELSAPVAFSAVATSLAMVGGWSAGPAYALWVVLVARAVPSILYVRSRIRLDRGRPHQTLLPVVTHGVGLIGVAGLVWLGLVPGLTLLAFVVLLIRVAVGLSRYRRPVSIKRIGFTEMGLGLFTVLCVAVGSWLNS